MKNYTNRRWLKKNGGGGTQLRRNLFEPHTALCHVGEKCSCLAHFRKHTHACLYLPPRRPQDSVDPMNNERIWPSGMTPPSVR